MKIIDERIGKQEVDEISEELSLNLSRILEEDYDISLDNNEFQFLDKELKKLISKFFDVGN